MAQTKPVEIQQAVFNYDFPELSRKGKRSAETKKKREQYRKQRELAQVMDKLVQGNEHICSADN